VFKDIIICRMGQTAPRLAVHHLAFGVLSLFKAFTNAACGEACRKAERDVEAFLARVPEPGAVFGYNAANVQFWDGIRFELFGTCTKSQEQGFSWETGMRWWWAECEIQPDGSIRSQPGRFRFDANVVLPQKFDGDVKNELQGAKFLDPNLPRKACRLVDSFASHRIFVPPPAELDELIVLEWLAQLVTRAAKCGLLEEGGEPGRLQDQACQVFREYGRHLGIKSLAKLSEEERLGAIDLAFRRLAMSKFGRGFLATTSRFAFRSYFRKTLYFAGRDVLGTKPTDCRDVRNFGDPSKPSGIVDAGERLNVNPSTIWRRMKKHGYTELTPDAWKQMQSEASTKASWQAIQTLLVNGGLTLASARKRVFRWKKAGRSPGGIARSELVAHVATLTRKTDANCPKSPED